MNISIHNVVDVKYRTVDLTKRNDKKDIICRILIITDNEGNTTEISLFSDKIVNFRQSDDII